MEAEIPDPFAPPPELPAFIAERFAFERRSYRLPSAAGDGLRLHFVDHGDPGARPVLLQHGNPTWSFLWRRVMERLPEFRLVAPDLLGLGWSSRLAAVGDHSVDRHADAIAGLVEALDLEDAIFVGQDWGGPILTSVAARLPERVAGLVLGNTAVALPRRPRGTAFHRFARLPVLSDLVFRVLGFPLRSLHRTHGDRRSIRGPVARAYRWPLRRMGDRIAPLAMARMVPDGPEHPSMPALRRGEAWANGFRGPIALVWGEKDPILGRALRRHEERFPQASVRRTAAGHFLQEEVPQELADAVRETASRAGAA